MENKANYALIGTFVLIAVAAAVGFILWLTDSSFDQQFDEYIVEFTGPVRGLSPGSEVRFNGINVGQVTTIRLDAENPNVVLATIQIDANTPVDTASRGVLEPLGLTGLSYLQITAGGENYPPMKSVVPRETPRIPGEGDAISSIIEGGGSVVEQAQIAIARVNMVLNDDAIQDFHTILDNLARLTTELDLSDFDMENVNGLVSDLRSTSRDFTAMAEAITVAAGSADSLLSEDAVQLLARMQSTLDEVDETLNAFEGTSGEADALIIDVRDAVNRLSNSGLTDIEETVDGIRRLVDSLGRVADALEQNPLTFISGTQADVVELPQ